MRKLGSRQKYKMRRCVILAGADIRRYDIVQRYLRKDDFIIACDCGIKHLKALSVEADLVVGDFDSANIPEQAKELIVLPREKDDTDSVYAVKAGIARGFDSFLIIGGFGNRLDHTFVNVYVLLMLKNAGKTAVAIDDYSELSIVGNKPVMISDNFPYFSLLNITGKADKVLVKNAKWNLENATITSEYQYATSNEVLLGQIAEVSVGDGELLLIKIFEK